MAATVEESPNLINQLIKKLINTTKWTLQNHRVEVYPQLTDVWVGLAEGVGAGVRIGAGGVGGHDGVGVVGAASPSTPDREDAAHSEGGGACSQGDSSQGTALRCRVASS